MVQSAPSHSQNSHAIWVLMFPLNITVLRRVGSYAMPCSERSVGVVVAGVISSQVPVR